MNLSPGQASLVERARFCYDRYNSKYRTTWAIRSEIRRDIVESRPGGR